METKKYKLEYTNILDEKNGSFEIDAADMKEAVKALVATFENRFNPANIEFDAVFVNGEPTGLDGQLEAEKALMLYYT